MTMHRVRFIFRHGLPQPFIVLRGILAAVYHISNEVDEKLLESHKETTSIIRSRAFLSLLEVTDEQVQELAEEEQVALYKIFKALEKVFQENSEDLLNFLEEALLGDRLTVGS
jgi:hypothetical protein